MPYGVLLSKRCENKLGCACSSREARRMHAPQQEIHRGPRRPQRGRITSKLKRVWVATGTSCAQEYTVMRNTLSDNKLYVNAKAIQ
jgi:hypothetical protein